MRRVLPALLAGIAIGAFVSAPTQSAPGVLGSTAISWEEIMAKPSGTGVTKAKQVLRDPTATLDELEFHVSFLPAGQTPHAPHQHPDEELIVVKEGTVEALVNGQTKKVGPGSVIFQASNQMHGLRNVGDTTAVYHVFRWNSPGMLKSRTTP